MEILTHSATPRSCPHPYPVSRSPRHRQHCSPRHSAVATSSHRVNAIKQTTCYSIPTSPLQPPTRTKLPPSGAPPCLEHAHVQWHGLRPIRSPPLPFSPPPRQPPSPPRDSPTVFATSRAALATQPSVAATPPMPPACRPRQDQTVRQAPRPPHPLTIRAESTAPYPSTLRLSLPRPSRSSSPTRASPET